MSVKSYMQACFCWVSWEWTPFASSRLRTRVIHHMHVQIIRIGAMNAWICMLEMNLVSIGTCMCLIYEIKLHFDVNGCLYHGSINIFGIWDIKCKLDWFECWIWAQELSWKSQKIWCSLERGNRRSSVKFMLPAYFAAMIPARAGKFTLEQGAI